MAKNVVIKSNKKSDLEKLVKVLLAWGTREKNNLGAKSSLMSLQEPPLAEVGVIQPRHKL